MLKHILILLDGDIAIKPRAYRAISMLKDRYKISLINHNKNIKIDGVDVYGYDAEKRRAQRSEEENQLIEKYCQEEKYENLIYTKNRAKIQEICHSIEKVDLIFVEDITLLPFGMEYKNINIDAKILIDLREYYPLEYEDEKYLNGIGKMFKYLCERCLSKVEYSISVSPSICAKYREIYGIRCELFLSLPPYFNLSAKEVDTNHIKVIYHGLLSSDRDSLNLIEIAKNLNQNITLYVMGLSNEKGLMEQMRESKNIRNLIFINPVDMPLIVSFCNDFDIGLIPFRNTSFNLEHCLPNKLFEYTQSRLCVVSTPLKEIASMKQNGSLDNVVLSPSFDAKDIANTINNIQNIYALKQLTDKNAHTLSTESNKIKLHRIIEQILDQI